MANLKNITELPVAESAGGLNLIVNDNGAAKQIAASAVGAQADWNETDENSPAFIKNKPKSVLPDWNQNDPSAPDYVKNRTHYEEEAEIALLPEALYTFEYCNNPVYTWMHVFVTDSSNELVAGETYSVVWDGVQYDNLVCEVDAEEGYVRIGGIMTPDGIDGYDFAIMYGYGSLELYTASTETSHSVCIICRKTVVHKLDAKYLPDSVQNKTYRFIGWNDGGVYVLEKGDWMECQEMFRAGMCETVEVLDMTNVPVVYPLTGIRDDDILEFQKLWYSRESSSDSYNQLVGGLIMIGPDETGYRNLPYINFPS